MKLKRFVLTLSGAGLLFLAYGCTPDSEAPISSTEADQSPAVQAVAEDEDHAGHDHDHAGHDHGEMATGDESEMTDMEKMEQTLAALPEEDRKSAMEQHICPVSGEMLGTMGLPEKMEVKGQTVWICCEGCKDKILAEPEKYLAKLEK